MPSQAAFLIGHDNLVRIEPEPQHAAIDLGDWKTAKTHLPDAALRDFDDCGMTYLVADITTPSGAAFARRYNVPHVTLLLFDAGGEMVQVVNGPSDADSLRQIFDTHLQTHS